MLDTSTDAAFCSCLVGEDVANGERGAGNVPGLAIFVTGANIPTIIQY